jgi:pimeloyl-ACP methyl ester carboxylesterase
VQRVVAVAGSAVDVPLSPEARAASREHGEALRSYQPGLENMRALTLTTLHNKELVTDELVQLRYEMSVHQAEGRANRSAAAEESMRPFTPEELRASYHRPTLILWGKDDHGNPIERGYRMFEAMPGAELHCFNACGHWPMWDQTEAFVSTVAAFLNRP